MRILGMNTCTDALSVAVMKDGILEGQLFLHVSKKHAETLISSAQSLLTHIGCDLPDIDALGVSIGPGSFTGVRIGTATVSAMAYALDVPVYSVSTLDALLAMCPPNAVCCAMLDARRNQVYVKATGPYGVIIEEEALTLADVLDRLKSESTVLFTGDAAQAHEQVIRQDFPGALLFPEAASWPTAAGVCALIAQDRATPAKPDTLRPVYLRVPQAERERLERLKRDSHRKTES